MSNNIHEWTAIVFYGSVVAYFFTVILSVIIHKDYKDGFIEEDGKFSSKTLMCYYYITKVCYIGMLGVMGAMFYFMYIILVTDGLL